MNKYEQNNKSSNNGEMPNAQLRFFHNILIMLEPDNPNTHRGYNWSQISQSDIKQFKKYKSTNDTIPENEIPEGEVHFFVNGSSSIAYSFLKCLRDAFAHNYIVISNGNIINIRLNRKNGTGLRMHAKIKFKELQKIAYTLIETRTISND